MSIALVGGGTGGHVMPILSLSTSLNLPKDEFFWIGGRQSMEE
jgi:UDP-N-acetylglucosamine:LPS N-acetylglucosamine transferase